MRRRDLLKAVPILLPAFSSFAAAEDEQIRFLKLRKLGVATRPFEVTAQISLEYNVYSRGGADARIASDIKTAIGDRLDPFVSELKKELLPTLAASGFTAVDIPYLTDAPFFASPYGAEEPFYLDCATFLSFSRIEQGRVAPGAGVFLKLISDVGRQQVYYRAITYGLVVFRPRAAQAVEYGVPAEQYESLDEVIASPDSVAKVLLSWAGPLGKAVGEVFSKEIKNTTPAVAAPILGGPPR